MRLWSRMMCQSSIHNLPANHPSPPTTLRWWMRWFTSSWRPSCLLPFLHQAPSSRRTWWLRQRRFDAYHERRNVREGRSRRKPQRTWAFGEQGGQRKNLQTWRTWGPPREPFRYDDRSWTTTLGTCKRCGQCGNRARGYIRLGFDRDGSRWWLERRSFRILWGDPISCHRKRFLFWYLWWKDL